MAVTQDHGNPRREPSLERDPAAGWPPRESVAETLRRTREGYGQDLRSVSHALRIRHMYLEAIESGDFDRLPGTAYAIGFLRTYAEYLGLDGATIVDRFKEEAEGVEERTELVFPEPVAEGRIPGGAIILISVLLLGIAYGGWLYLSDRGQNISDVLPEMPERLQGLLAEEQAAPAGESAVAAAEALREPTAEAGAAAPGRPESTTTPEHPASSLADFAPPSASGLGPPSEPRSPQFEGREGPVAESPVAGEAGTEAQQAQAPDRGTASRTEPEGSAPGAEEAAGERAIMDQPPVASAEPSPAPASEAAANDPPLPPPVSPADEAPSLPPPQPAPAAAVSMPEAGSSAADAQEDLMAHAPVVEETVVIPSPPSGSQSLIIPTARTPRVYGDRTGETRIVLRAVQDSWVQVRDAQDALLMTRVLRAGDAYFVPDQDGLTLLTGNAGGIEIEVDGVRAPPLGPVGAVRRQIALDPKRLLDGTAAPN